MRLPPLNALRAFEAAARHQGYIAAAEELFVTRGAISRHVKLLEDHLGVQLFKRHAKGVDLTEAGRRFLPVLTEAFRNIATEAERLTTAGNDLRIICPPSISIRWLIPRLERFRIAHPDIRLRLTTDFYGEDGFDTSEFDIGFSVENVTTRPAHIMVQPLLPVVLSPACAPDLLDQTPLKFPVDLSRVTLLHEHPGRNDWRAWVAHFGVGDIDPDSGDVLPNVDMATKAAVIGAGVVMADLLLCRDELCDGRLVLPFPDLQCPSPMGRYCLIGPQNRWHSANVKLFRDWVAQIAEQETST